MPYEQSLTGERLIAQVKMADSPAVPKQTFKKPFVEATISKRGSTTRGNRLDLSMGAFHGQRSRRTTFSVEKVVTSWIILATFFFEKGVSFTPKTTFKHRYRDSINVPFDTRSSMKYCPPVGGFLNHVPTAGRI